MVSAYVDGHYATDIVIMSSARVTRQFALGTLRAGRHTLRLHYAAQRSPSKAGVAKLRDIGFKTVRRGSPAVRRRAVRAGALRPQRLRRSAAASRTTARTPRWSPGTRCCPRPSPATR